MQKCIVQSILSREKFAKSNRLRKVIIFINVKHGKVLRIQCFRYFPFLLEITVIYADVRYYRYEMVHNWCKFFKKLVQRPSLYLYVINEKIHI